MSVIPYLNIKFPPITSLDGFIGSMTLGLVPIFFTPQRRLPGSCELSRKAVDIWAGAYGSEATRIENHWEGPLIHRNFFQTVEGW